MSDIQAEVTMVPGTQPSVMQQGLDGLPQGKQQPPSPGAMSTIHFAVITGLESGWSGSCVSVDLNDSVDIDDSVTSAPLTTANMPLCMHVVQGDRIKTVAHLGSDFLSGLKQDMFQRAKMGSLTTAEKVAMMADEDKLKLYRPEEWMLLQRERALEIAMLWVSPQPPGQEIHVLPAPAPDQQHAPPSSWCNPSSATIQGSSQRGCHEQPVAPPAPATLPPRTMEWQLLRSISGSLRTHRRPTSLILRGSTDKKAKVRMCDICP